MVLVEGFGVCFWDSLVGGGFIDVDLGFGGEELEVLIRD